jgi:hypothetical protein
MYLYIYFSWHFLFYVVLFWYGLYTLWDVSMQPNVVITCLLSNLKCKMLIERELMLDKCSYNMFIV